MRQFIYGLSLAGLIFSICAAFYVTGFFGYYIEQDVKACNDGGKFQVYTYVWHNGEILSLLRTWHGSDEDCLDASVVRKTKTNERIKALIIVSEYKKATK